MTRKGKVIIGNDGKPIMTRQYSFTIAEGKKVIIQDHSAGHQFYEGGKGDQGSHFNVRPEYDIRNGRVKGTKSHYPYIK